FCDIEIDRAKKGAEQYGTKDAKVYADYRDLLKDEAKCSLSGTEGGADMKDGLRINGEDLGKSFVNEIDVSTGGVAYYDGAAESNADLEARLWIESIINDTEPIVKPEQALVVTQILEAIYESAKLVKQFILTSKHEKK